MYKKSTTLFFQSLLLFATMSIVSGTAAETDPAMAYITKKMDEAYLDQRLGIISSHLKNPFNTHGYRSHCAGYTDNFLRQFSLENGPRNYFKGSDGRYLLEALQACITQEHNLFTARDNLDGQMREKRDTVLKELALLQDAVNDFQSAVLEKKTTIE
jgi:hypothetical protein